MRFGIIILGAVVSFLTAVSADADCFGFDDKTRPIQWQDIGGDEIRQHFSGRVCRCSVISINDECHEKGKNSKIKECLNYGDSRAELELTSLEGPRVRYGNCYGKYAFGGDMELAADPDTVQNETVNVKLSLNVLGGNC